MESSANKSNESKKTELSDRLIVEIYKKVNELAEEKRLDKNIKYCDSKLKLF